MQSPVSQFMYFVVSEGNDLLLKEEILRGFPDLKLAYSRKQFLTYKLASPSIYPRYDLGIVFAFSSGLTLIRADATTLASKIDACLQNPIFKEKPIFNSFLCSRDLNAEIRTTFAGRFKDRDFKDSDLVLELIQSHENEFYLGVHGYGPHRTILNDYAEPIVPSRSYHKIREAFLLAGLTPQKGQSVLDLGAAPGGTSYFFLQHGLNVCALDPADMHPLCKADPLFEHRQISIDKLGTLQLNGRGFDWLTLDINLDPLYLTHELERILELLPHLPRGLFFTVKLTRNFSRERLPEFIRIIKSLQFKKVIAKQVPSHRSEFLLFASPE